MKDNCLNRSGPSSRSLKYSYCDVDLTSKAIPTTASLQGKLGLQQGWPMDKHTTDTYWQSNWGNSEQTNV